MDELLTQTATLMTSPVFDDYGKAISWGGSVILACRYVNRRRYSSNIKDNSQMIEGDLTVKETLKLGDILLIDGVKYKVYESNSWRYDDPDNFGSYSKLILA
jgi:hypothetical protein